MKQIVLFFIAVLFITAAPAQVIKPVKWTISSRQVGQDQVDLIFKAVISSPWHMYGLNIAPGGPIAATINFEDTKGFVVIGKPTQSPKPATVYDKIFEMQLELHSGQVTFTQRIKKTQSDSIRIKGNLEYETCSDMQCVMGNQDFVFSLKGLDKGSVNAAAVPDQKQTENTPVNSGNEPVRVKEDSTGKVMAVSEGAKVQNNTTTDHVTGGSASSGSRSLWGVFLLALVAGLGGLLTPCVYPMIPLTVSYFLRGNKSRSRSITEALVFGLSIVLLYTLIGVLVAVFKNPNAVNDFTTNWITNLIFCAIFLILSASFFGMFEITLPSGLANKIDRQADRGGYLGAFFMAVAMAVLSFSCTGPIVASLLIKASQGEVLEPIVGMAGFSVIFALPFTLFAIFPSWLQGLPKSGSWLNMVKVFFAFVMLAFSLYFLGKIDQSYHLNLISRNLFLSIWTVIFAMLGLYFLGKIKFELDSDLPHLGVPRFIFAIASFSFALYLFTGLFGAELKPLSTILPPDDGSSASAETRLMSGITSNSSSGKLCSTPRYADILSLPYNMHGYFDYQEALTCAREQNKPVLVDFVGHTCSNCKKMYAEVWSDPRVLQLLNDKFIVVALYTDDKTRLPESEWITSSIDGKVKNTLAKKNQDFQITRFNSNALPLYAIVDANGKDLTKTYYTYDPSIDKFISWLNTAIK